MKRGVVYLLDSSMCQLNVHQNMYFVELRGAPKGGTGFDLALNLLLRL